MKLSPSVTIEQSETGLEFIKVASEFCDATIFLQGAQITEFTPTGKKPLLWVSQLEDYQEGKGVRGGIPICWPWFGVSQHEGWPAHGVARTGLWRAEQVKEEENSIYISLSLPMNQIDEKYWPHKTKLLVEFILSTSLEVRLTTTNLDNETLNFTQALHTYFPTPAIEETKVDGLQGSKYIEFGEGPFEQHDLVSFARETMFILKHKIHNASIRQMGSLKCRENSRSCVLWNPWIDKSKRLSNFADDEYHVMLCLEANVLEDSVELASVTSIHLSLLFAGYKKYREDKAS